VTRIDNPALTFQRTDVTVWAEQIALFKKAREIHGRVDHVFANAGVGPRADYLSTAVDANGDLVEPTFVALDVNLKAVIYTATIAVYYMREEQQTPAGGSIVIASSVAGVSRFRAIDYGKNPPLTKSRIARYSSHKLRPSTATWVLLVVFTSA
jgi:NAD(P)-dependent dehydrogenase (short-subunit alcohol dehydrogenase family)